VGLERDPLSLASTAEELLGRQSSGSGIENRADHANIFHPQKLTLTSPTSGGCSVGIVRSRTKATEFVSVPLFNNMLNLNEDLTIEYHG
jgi:hypothetical protein